MVVKKVEESLDGGGKAKRLDFEDAKGCGDPQQQQQQQQQSSFRRKFRLRRSLLGFLGAGRASQDSNHRARRRRNDRNDDVNEVDDGGVEALLKLCQAERDQSASPLPNRSNTIEISCDSPRTAERRFWQLRGRKKDS
ncbi:hypothetical protein TKK_0003839 [Trichogramma kaykai]